MLVKVLLLPIGASTGLTGSFTSVHGLKKKPLPPLLMLKPVLAAALRRCSGMRSSPRRCRLSCAVPVPRPLI